jgi:Glycine zipper 2TM domain
MMKRMIFGTTLAAIVMTSTPALAQRDWREREARKEYRDDVRDERQDRREDRKEYRRDRREAWQNYRRYDYNRSDPRYGNYYAERYYRDGRYYKPYRLSTNDRVYRGGDNRYYCRRSDGTTGLIVGAAVGGLLGNEIGRGRSNTLGAILGAAGGGLLGREIERGNVRCS